MEEKYIDYKGEKIYYKIGGHGSKTIVFIHGFPEDSNVFFHQVESLKKEYKIIVPDLAGAGKSNYNPNIESVEDYAISIHEIIQTENLNDLTILGHSMGGYVTLAFVALYPELISKFGLIHSSATADSDEKVENRFKAIENIEKLGVKDFCKNAIESNFAPNFPKENPSIIEKLVEFSRQSTIESLQHFQEIMIKRSDRTDILKLHKPVLFILGTQDKPIPLETVLPQVSIPEISSVTILEDVGHMSMWEAPEKLHQAIKNFMEI